MSLLPEALAAMPARARIPIERLLEKKLIDEETITTALEAVRIARAPDRLLPFSTAILYLKSQGIAVRDTVEMAKQLGRPIRLDWTPARWTAEHDTLSRMMTLRQLAAENAHYTVDTWLAQLPAEFPGYLIRSSRRLGWEGLHQRHCVASYHRRLLAGDCAIAVVWVDRTRYTVELLRLQSSDKGSALTIRQAATRGNRAADRPTLRRIHEILGVPFAASVNLGQRARPSQVDHLENLRRILRVLREHSVAEVRISFDGSGDSGTIDDVVFTPQIDAEGIRVQVREAGVRWSGEVFSQEAQVSDVTLLAAVEQLADAWIDQAGVNWYDNDGGYGELLIDVQEGTIGLNVNVRYTESSCEHSSLINIESGEPA